MNDFLRLKSLDINGHGKLVQLISEESALLEITTSPEIIQRHSLILDFLIELQIITSKKLFKGKTNEKAY